MKAKDCVGIVLVIMLLLPWPVLAAPVGKITNLQGNVDITSPGKAARIAKVGDGVNVGDFIRAKSKSKVEITFNEGNVLRLGENSRVGITRYMPVKNKTQASSIFFAVKFTILLNLSVPMADMKCIHPCLSAV